MVTPRTAPLSEVNPTRYRKQSSLKHTKMKVYFVKMQDPNNGLFYNVGDFQKLEDAIYDAETCKYPSRVYEVAEDGSKLIGTTEKINTHE